MHPLHKPMVDENHSIGELLIRIVKDDSLTQSNSHDKLLMETKFLQYRFNNIIPFHIYL